MEFLDQRIKKLKNRLEHKQEFTNIEERLHKLETIAVEDKTIASRNRQLVDVIHNVQNDVRELQIELNELHKEIGIFKITIGDTVKAVDSGMGKIDVLNDVIAHHKSVLDSLTVKVSDISSIIEDTQDKVVAIGHDEELEKFRKMFEDFKKNALLIDNSGINES